MGLEILSAFKFLLNPHVFFVVSCAVRLKRLNVMYTFSYVEDNNGKKNRETTVTYYKLSEC